jgi:hypothetical protein
MRRRLTLIACLALMASLTRAAKAGSIMGDVTLTVAQSPYALSGADAISHGPSSIPRALSIWPRSSRDRASRVGPGAGRA